MKRHDVSLYAETIFIDSALEEVDYKFDPPKTLKQFSESKIMSSILDILTSKLAVT